MPTSLRRVKQNTVPFAGNVLTHLFCTCMNSLPARPPWDILHLDKSTALFAAASVFEASRRLLTGGGRQRSFSADQRMINTLSLQWERPTLSSKLFAANVCILACIRSVLLMSFDLVEHTTCLNIWCKDIESVSIYRQTCCNSAVTNI